jgi:tetratricopeptide (TPR) repeat protein
MGEHEKALTQLETALESLVSALGPGHRHVLLTLEAIARVQIARGKYDTALETLDRVYAPMVKACGADHPDLATTLIEIGRARMGKGDRQQGFRSFKQALDIQKAALGADHPRVAETLSQLAGVYLDPWFTDYALALEFAEKAAAIQRETLGANHPALATTLMQLGLAQKHSGRPAEAVRSFEEVLRLRKPSLAPDDPVLGQIHFEIGAMLQVRQRDGLLKLRRDRCRCTPSTCAGDGQVRGSAHEPYRGAATPATSANARFGGECRTGNARQTGALRRRRFFQDRFPSGRHDPVQTRAVA